ncbi:hypothetical protein IGJ48_000773 [Enterococcus pernyi]
MKSIDQKRQEKERGVSVKDVIDSLDSTDLTDIVVIAINKNQEQLFAYSHEDRLRIIGMMEWLKQTLIDEMNYPEEL